jgi:hypothetical protein
MPAGMKIHLEEPQLRSPPGRSPKLKKRPKSAPASRPTYNALGLSAKDQEKRRLQLGQVSYVI